VIEFQWQWQRLLGTFDHSGSAIS